MANNDNIIYARFNHGHEITTDPRSQYAYGQVVKISGLHLPASFDADIANKGDKQAKATIGTNNELPIDDNYFLSGKDIIVMINVHATDKDGRTKYIINIPINKRSKRADIELEPVEQDVVSTAIATLNEAIEQTSANAESAENSANRAHESAMSAEQSATNASNSETLVKQYAERAEIAAESSEKSETNAKASEESAKQSESHAEQIANDIEQFTERAETASRNAESSATIATEKADEISESADIATAKANEASNAAKYAGEAATYAGEFANSAFASADKSELNAQKTQSDKEVVELAKTDVMSAVDSAQNYAESAQSANQAIQDMNVQAVTLDVGSDVTVEKTVDPATGAVTLTYGIPKGIKGDKGDTGEQGIQGIQGEKGDKGDQGIQGIQGEKGEQGIQGIQGERGEKGEKGDQGEQGIQGERGLTGANGFSPTVSTSEITGGHQVVITDTNGEHSFLVMNGEKGEKGDPATGMEIHICGSSEYDAETRIPTIANPNDKTFYLVPTEDGTSPDLFTEWVYVNNAWEMFGSASVDLSGYLTDVKINGNSVVTDGVANIPKANSSTYGVVKVNGDYGIGKMGDGSLTLMLASERESKDGTNMHNIIAPINQHISTFYGLAKASGDTTQSQSDNPVGTYTDEAKASIKNMLGVEDVDIDSKAPVITETISGDIVSFDDGANDMPLQSLVVDIEPVQDLNGYDSPWVGGAGKNLFGVKNRIDMTQAQLTFTSDADYIIVNGTKYGQTTFVLTQAPTLLKAGTYYFKAFTSGAATGVVYVDIYDVNNTRLIQNIHGSERSYTFTEDTEIYVGIRVNDNNVLTNYTIGVVMSASSGITEFTPYENICPISGFTGCEVQRTGVNLFDGVIESGDYDVTASADGAKRNNASRMRCANFIPVKSNTTYYSKSSYSNSVVVFYDEEKWMRSNGGYAVAMNTTFTTPSWCKYITFYFNGTQYNNDISINYPATDTDYHPYTGQTYDISWESEAGAIYGGYVDVLSGKLTLTYYFCTPNNAKRITYGIDAQSNLPYAFFSFVQSGSAVALSSRTLCSMYKAGTVSNVDKALRMWTSEADIWDSDLDVTSLDTVKAYFADLMIVYPLATPIEIQLDAHTIKTLYGQNNIFANTGDVSVEYRADTELYIDKQIPDVPVDDVQINGTRIVENGVANVPIATGNRLGVVQGWTGGGTQILSDGRIGTVNPSVSEIKAGSINYKPIPPSNQHISTFYGLAKAAGDTTQSSSSNAVGEYTDSAKTAIKNMLGVIDGGGTISETITGTDPTITAQNNFRYMCGELYTLNFTPCVSGVCEVIFTSGATPTILTLPDTVRMPAWWTGVEANTTYEISIVDGVYGAVMSWS